MEGMNKLILMIGSVMPTEKVIEMMEEGIAEYKSTGNTDKLHVPCTLLLSKEVTDVEGLEPSLEKMDQIEINQEMQNIGQVIKDNNMQKSGPFFFLNIKGF